MDIQETIHTLFEEHVERCPDGIAIVYDKKSMSYKELNKKANQLAHFLRKKGICADTPVAVCLPRSVDFLITIMAILKAGAAYLPLDPSYPEERLLFVLKDSQAPILITESLFQEKFTEYQGTLIVLDHDKKHINAQSSLNLNATIKPQQLAYVIYTSGSTGAPKGVLIEHKSAVNYCDWFSDYSRLSPEHRIDFSSNPTFDMAITLTIVPLMLGLTIVLCKDEVKKDIRHYLKYLKKNKVNCIKLTPSFFKVLLQEVNSKFIALPDLKSLILGGENLSVMECKSWLGHYPKQTLFNEYGPTEATVGMSLYKVSTHNLADLELNVPIGQVGMNMSCIILDENGLAVPDGDIGELYIGGDCLARGYLNRPEFTQKQFIKNPRSSKKQARLYKTGDLCRKRSDGIMEYIGRIDNQVKIRGFRIEPGEIEQHLSAHAAIESAVVLAQKDAVNENRLVAYYIPKEPHSAPSTNQIRHYLSTHLPEHMIPSAFVSVNSFPLTANGKLDQALLPKPQFTASQNYKEPLTDLEKTLAEIWSEELGIQLIGIHDDFFELGGHSLSAARIISKINSALKKNIALYDFYQGPTIAQLAILTNKSRRQRGQKQLNKKLYKNLSNIPLSDFQFMLWMSNTFEAKAKKINITARKRLQGKLNQAALTFAFEAVLKKQEVLFYRILKFRPTQFLQTHLPFKISEEHLESLTEQECESRLTASMNQLIDYYPWPKDSPLIIAKLFYMNNDVVELQICMPHIVSDDVSPSILLSELSHFYHLYHEQPKIKLLKTDTLYKEYIFNEHYYFQSYMDRDISFWDEYLKDASLFTFPKAHVVKNMEAKNLPYSTYLQLPEEGLNNLKQFCEKNHVSLNDGLCAALSLALQICSLHDTAASSYILINIVKSTRDNPIYDETIGCFLRLEPIKITLNQHATLETLSKQVHQSTIETSPYQKCPGLIKLTSTSTFRKKAKAVSSVVNMLSTIYTRIFRVPKVYLKIFKRCGGRLMSFKRENHFIINMNVQNSFVLNSHQKPEHLFGLNTTEIKNNQYDLLNVDSFFDVCFLRDGSQNIPYLAISANLDPKFRTLIGQQVIQIMNCALDPAANIGFAYNVRTEDNMN